jgi:hypothetical protein
MNNIANLTLSSGELALAMDKDIILTKKIIIEKAFSLLNEMIKPINGIFSTNLFQYQSLSTAIPKIYKGENYNSFPYVLMDYPSTFDKENIFTIRTMFWWGNFVSITLLLSGKYKSIFYKNILNNIDDSFFICINENQWQHHFEEDNYKKYSSLTDVEIENIMQKEFIKIALKYELHHWNMMQQILPEGYKKINELLLTTNSVE